MPAMPFWLEWLLLATAGVAAGALNVVAGGGSFLILPLLLFLGLPSALANGTNRVGVIAQNLAASPAFIGIGRSNGRGHSRPASRR